MVNEEKYCKCGCGQKIIIKFRHNMVGIPDYLPRHNWSKKIYTDIKKHTIRKKDIIKNGI